MARLWIEQPIALFERCAGRYGETFTLELGSVGTTVLFSHPEAVRQIFQLPPESYECRPFNEYYGSLMGPRSLFLTDGADHRRMRRVLMPPLHRRLVETHGESTRRLVGEIVAGWPLDRAFSPRSSMHLLALRIILEVIFGSPEDVLGGEIARVFSEEIYQQLGSWSAWTRFGHLHPRFRERIGEEIRRRRRAPDGGGSSLFDAMVRARDDAGNPMSEAEIEDHIFTMLVAGVDTVALALSWALYEIHEEPEVLARLQGDLDSLGPDPAARDVVELPYLAAAYQETLRLHPIPSTPSGRKLVVPVEIQGRRYEPGVTLLPCTYLVHRRPDLYPEPNRFRPERFLERSFASHEYLPFGGGARTCIGATLSPLTMMLVLSELVRCELSPAHEGPVVSVRHGTLLAPSDALKFVRTGCQQDRGGEPK